MHATGERRRDVGSLLEASGGLAHVRQLVSAGVSADAVERAVRTGDILRVRPGIYAHPAAPADLIRAARVGGRLAGASAARRHGLWVPPGCEELVVEVSRSASRLRDPDDASLPLTGGAGVRVLWGRTDVCRAHAFGLVPLRDALRQVVRLESTTNAVAILDSALRRSPTTEFDLHVLAADATAAERAVYDLVDGRAESGTESAVRVELALVGITAVPQVRIPFTDLGRLDLLIGDRLVIECDSERHHGGAEQRLRDLRRDAELAALGFIVLRFDYRQIFPDPAGALAAVRRYVDLGLHIFG